MSVRQRETMRAAKLHSHQLANSSTYLGMIFFAPLTDPQCPFVSADSAGPRVAYVTGYCGRYGALGICWGSEHRLPFSSKLIHCIFLRPPRIIILVLEHGWCLS